MRVANILRRKDSGILTVHPSETAAAVAKKFSQHGVGAMVVCEDGASLDGLLTERDVISGLASYGTGVFGMPVSSLMEASVVTCAPEAKITDVARVMTERRLRHLPVKDGDRLVGIVSIGDVLKYRLDEMQLESRVLRDIAIASRVAAH